MSNREFVSAISDFQKARQRASLEKMISRWTGKSLDLLSYEEVRNKLQIHSMADVGLRQIPLDAIVGSVGRYRDFSRTFLPRSDSDKDRWAGVKMAQVTKGLPPISVYQIGEAYFVQDGNHRVSVARQLGNDTIEAYVTEVKTKVPLEADDEPDDIILKAEYAHFLEQTHLDEIKPDIDMRLTAPGNYPVLLDHIEIHRYYMGLEEQREISYEEAVAHWSDEVYRPTMQLIQEAGLCRDFPDRTEADMYVWLSEHRAEIEEMLGWEVPVATAVSDMAEKVESFKPAHLVSRVLNVVLPGTKEKARPVGQWRQERLKTIGGPNYFRNILVPVNGEEMGWEMVDQAIIMAQREESRIHGLFAVSNASQQNGILAQTMQAEFARRCANAGVPGELMVEVGDFETLISKRTRWVDSMVIRPSSRDAEPVYHRIIRRASGPLLYLPGEVSSLDHALLAYDGTQVGDEALFMASYLGLEWQIPVTVVHVTGDPEEGDTILKKAAEYLDYCGVEPALIAGEGDTAETILKAAAGRGCNFIIAGSPGLNSMFELALGSTISDLLDSSTIPLLICR